MYVQYGRVPLRVVELIKFQRRTVWDQSQTDLIGVKQILGFVCTYAPGGQPKLVSATRLSTRVDQSLRGDDPTAALLAVGPRGFDPDYRTPALEDDTGRTIPPELWLSGPQTDAELQQHLLIPRQRLILWAYDRQSNELIRWLESPRPNFPIDLDDGPLPICADVVSVAGEPDSVTVYFEISTTTSACPIGSDRLVLSHRWEMEHDHDENHYLTRVTKGTVTFNQAILEKFHFQPDALRNQLLPPIPVGFERKPPRVTLSTDGKVLTYEVRDVDPTITFDPGTSGATVVSIQEKVLYNVPKSTQR